MPPLRRLRRGGVLAAWIFLGACEHPITNLPFYEDAAYVAALPSEERVGVPSRVRLARVGTSTMLADAVAASAELQETVEVLLRSGEVLRSAEPDARTEVARSWEGVQAAGDLGGERLTWWVRGEVLRVSEGSDVTWTIELAADAAGPWEPVGEGRHDPSGYGTATWDRGAARAAIAAELDTERGVVLAVDYDDDTDGSGTRQVTIKHTHGPELVGQWTAVGSVSLAWFGSNALTDPVLPGAFQVLTDDNGGWGVGELYVDSSSLDIISCWSPVGDTVFAAGSALEEGHGATLSATGSEADCPTPFPF